MRKPVIGIGGSVTFEQGGLFPGYERAYVSNDYVKAVSMAGGAPVILPIVGDKDLIKAQIDSISGLVISGGYDVDPITYGEEPTQKLGFIYPERDTYDVEIIKETIRQNKPILGICRGIQILNVALGGTLYQDLSLIEGCYVNHTQNSKPYVTGHTVEIMEGSKLHDLLGAKVLTNSFHHQALKDLAPGLKVTARAKDGVIEAVEGEARFLMGIQWHPEMLAETNKEMLKLFEELVKQSM